MDKKDYLQNIPYIDDLYKEYLENPENTDASWKSFFEGFDIARQQYPVIHGKEFDSEVKVLNLIDGYRKRGHYFTATNPVRKRRDYQPTLDITHFGLQESDLTREFHAGKELGLGKTTLSNIIGFLQQTYCRTIGVEYQYIRKPEVVDWLRQKMEEKRNTPTFSPEHKKHIYTHLVHAVGFETFIHKKFIGQKRFSLEGAESLIPALDAIIEKGAELGVKEFVIGMSHRGRLNVLTNIMKKPYLAVFSEFSGKSYDDENILGDVKYHLGYDNIITTDTGHDVNLILLPNPSHLETVGPVTQGVAKARIETNYANNANAVAPILIHGDAALASQGVVYETIQMSQLPGYKTGGTIHLVVNNQIGFTTDYTEARSSTYCTDIAKVVWAPIFHVNGDDVEALVYTIQLAMEYREVFHTDVFIDILCYRKYGHNEGDEPRFTQPVLYKAISSHPNVRDIYTQYLLEKGVVEAPVLEKIKNDFEEKLESDYNLALSNPVVHVKHFLAETWKNYRQPDDLFKTLDTSIPQEDFIKLLDAINYLPEDRKFFNKSYKIVEDRKKMVETEHLDWALGELAAYGSLSIAGFPVRLSGQDSVRGTFSHRHAAFVEEDSENKYFPLQHLSSGQAKVEVFNSPLSEYGVMGFDYGYALANPKGLTIWEAQFGDFHNVAQVIIDQYLSSAEEKWGLMNGLVLLLPHGYEGQGPEHSSARIERFLIQAANNNMIIANCTSPANFFHLLRRQVLLSFRKPLIVFTPKSLLRHPQCVSAKKDFTQGHFQEVIPDETAKPDVQQVVLCSGKLYYDLLAERENTKDNTTALVRVEQLHPFPLQQIEAEIQKYPQTTRVVWAQEEPANMGAWYYVQRQFETRNIIGICKPASGSTDSGLYQQHLLRTRKIMDKVFKRCNCDDKEIFCSMKCQKAL
ncbi:MAG: 2-oxoglutarate dehydrogenase E1 component [Bacteroidetes bacterium HGW-Bacteroidetes-21]|jgi:2-oxoglutarate dehydrogenase E1 component|nr:MAG: 2-oxoglutarate dehydrogenase E1 component [Bacteroidetes bacterium HGW-Bacteroidetes-21]